MKDSMSKAVFATIEKTLKTDLGLNYEYGRWKSEPVYPYWVGEIQESVMDSEDGCQESTLILQGHSRDGLLPLEDTREALEQLFNPISGYKVIADNGNAVAIFYGNSQHVRSVDAELERMDIYLNIKEWKVNL